MQIIGRGISTEGKSESLMFSILTQIIAASILEL
jgi:hypothetical protein